MALITPNDFFDEIFVLTIPRRTNRWFKLRERLIREDIYVKLYEGFDKEHPTMKKRFKSFRQLHPKYEWSDGNYTIMHSFIKLFTHILNETDCKTILICEDDILFHHDFKNLFNIAVTQIPKNWQIWYLGYVRWDLTELKYVNDNKHFVYPNNMTGNFAVAYKREIIPNVLKSIENSLYEGRLTTDQTIRKYFHKRSNTYISNPMLIGHSLGFSDTANKEFTKNDWGRREKIGRYIDTDIYH